MAKREPHKPDGLLAIVTNGDDMAYLNFINSFYFIIF